MRVLASLSFLSALTLLTASASASTFTDGFSGATVQLAATSAGNFSAVGGTNIDVLGPADGFGYLCTTATPCVDLGGTGGVYQGVLQSNTFFAQGQYLLSYDLTGSFRGVTTISSVTFGNYAPTPITLTSTQIDDVVGQLVTVGPGGSYLTFYDDLGANDIGAVLNTVSVTPVASSPEPSSLVLLGSGLLGGAGALLRRRKK